MNPDVTVTLTTGERQFITGRMLAERTEAETLAAHIAAVLPGPDGERAEADARARVAMLTDLIDKLDAAYIAAKFDGAA